MRRDVALKILKPGMDSRQILARFHAERQALAVMSHPSIAQVFDAGTTEEGRPFFAMEFVEGERITDYCDRRRLGIRSRIELFVQVAEAVQHAHLKGVIHRDLKPSNLPSNLLVTEVEGRPLVKVIDLPTARLHAELGAGLAEAGTPIGTHDLWIAASAVSRGLRLVTLNAREFERVPGLRLEVWG